jgi:hypothetical protein
VASRAPRRCATSPTRSRETDRPRSASGPGLRRVTRCRTATRRRAALSAQSGSGERTRMSSSSPVSARPSGRPASSVFGERQRGSDVPAQLVGAAQPRAGENAVLLGGRTLDGLQALQPHDRRVAACSSAATWRRPGAVPVKARSVAAGHGRRTTGDPQPSSDDRPGSAGFDPTGARNARQLKEHRAVGPEIRGRIARDRQQPRGTDEHDAAPQPCTQRFTTARSGGGAVHHIQPADRRHPSPTATSP